MVYCEILLPTQKVKFQINQALERRFSALLGNDALQIYVAISLITHLL